MYPQTVNLDKTLAIESLLGIAKCLDIVSSDPRKRFSIQGKKGGFSDEGC
ncbi:MAG: hypothetical protein WCW31_01285 [Patescibacteria group bacterium]|jgi:hypothetical protein